MRLTKNRSRQGSGIAADPNILKVSLPHASEAVKWGSPQEFGLKLWHTWTFAIGYFTGESQTVYDITIYTDAVEN
jgi:hypothetical protein